MNVALLLLALVTAAPAARPSALRDGDLVFQTSRSGQSQAVSLATGSALTHMGVVFVDGGVPWVLEAVEPVKRTPFDAWRRRGAGHRVWVRRLADADAVLTPAAVARMREVGQGWLGRHYDLQFRWDDDRLYCSELAHKLYERAVGVRLGAVQRAGDLALDAPAVRRKLRERFGPGAFDPAEPVVTPQAIFDDPRLVDVPVP